jgi:protein-S-isoprenylcysteine O-methyltransferase Ste14
LGQAKTALFMLLVPGLLLVGVPVSLMLSRPALFSFGILRWLAVPLWLVGGAALLWCAYDFIARGHGTPLPLDPPKQLVISGLYRTVRNPMYAGGLVFLLGHVLWSPSRAILAYPVLFFVATHLFVTLYEEPHLRQTFGAAYEQYCREVPRWIPKIR